MSSSIETLDQAVLAPYLEQNVAGFSGLRDVQKFADGQSNPTFKIVADSGNYVLRRQPPGKLLKSAHAVDREFRVLAASLGVQWQRVMGRSHFSEQEISKHDVPCPVCAGTHC